MGEYFEARVSSLRESKLNPRKHYDAAKIAELAESIKPPVGIIEPLVVRIYRNSPINEPETSYEIIAGSRRFRAAKLIAMETVPAVVRELTDEQALEIMVIENNQREDVNALEEAEGYRALLHRSYTLERLAGKIGRSEKYVYDRLKLLELIPEAQQLLLANKMTPGHAILIARLKPEDQKRVIDVGNIRYFHEGGLFQNEHGLFDDDEREEKKNSKDPLAKYVGFKARSVRELESWIDRHVRFDKKAPVDQMLFPETAATLQTAAEKKEKIVQVTHNLQTPPDAKEGNTERIYHASSWKRADGSPGHKSCDNSVIGVVCVGADRSKSFRVCLSTSGCDVHWAKEKRERARAAQSGGGAIGGSPAIKESPQAAAKRKGREAREQAENERRVRQQQAWDKAQPKIIEACVAKFKTAKFVHLDAVVKHWFEGFYLELDQHDFNRAKKLLGAPKTVEDLGRALVLSMLFTEWSASEEDIDDFSKRAKQFGVDIPAILKQFEPAPEKPQTSAKMKPGKGYDEPTCTECHCTELAPCDPPCSWAKLNKKTNAGVCTTCAVKLGRKKVEQKKVDSIKTPKAPKAKRKTKGKAKTKRKLVGTSVA